MSKPANVPYELTEGAVVFDSAGEDLGTISATSDGYFKVDVKMGHDFWLPYDAIQHADNDRVKLRLSRAEVEGRKLDSGAEDLAPPDSDVAPDLEGRTTPTEERYSAESDYLLHPRPQI